MERMLGNPLCTVAGEQKIKAVFDLLCDFHLFIYLLGHLCWFRL
jgi:hypothetical protein